MDLRLCTCILAAALLISLLPAAADAQGPPHTPRIVVIGDSLSDTGRADILSTAMHEHVSSDIPIIPGPHYFEGRFSNGRVWVEVLAEKLGLPAPRPVEEGRSARGHRLGTNFAVGGAQTETVLHEGLFPISPHPAIIQMDQQVAHYIASTGGRFADRDLFVVWGGANDILFAFTQVPWFADLEDGWPLDPEGAESAENIVDHVRALYGVGARDFIVPNLPLLGSTTPLGLGFPGDDVAEALDGFSMAFNDHLNDRLDDLEKKKEGITIVRLDVAGLVAELFADPELPFELGSFAALVDIGGQIQPLRWGMSDEATLLPIDDEDGFLFWDLVHVSAKAHQILAERAFQTLSDDLLAELAAAADE